MAAAAFQHLAAPFLPFQRQQLIPQGRRKEGGIAGMIFQPKAGSQYAPVGGFQQPGNGFSPHTGLIRHRKEVVIPLCRGQVFQRRPDGVGQPLFTFGAVHRPAAQGPGLP